MEQVSPPRSGPRVMLQNNKEGEGCLAGRRVDVSPTDVSPTKNSWMLRPLNKASPGYCVPDPRPWTASSRELAPSAAIAASVGLRRLNESFGRLAGFAYSPDQVY
jgi:hypothetical protein